MQFFLYSRLPSIVVTTLESNFLLRNITLSYCLETIDGILISDMFEGQDSDDARLSLIEGMDEEVLSIISKEYDKISGNQAQIKTKEETAEVVKEVKK